MRTGVEKNLQRFGERGRRRILGFGREKKRQGVRKGRRGLEEEPGNFFERKSKKGGFFSEVQ